MSALSRIKLAELERLRAENERLLAALREAEADKDRYGHKWAEARAELERLKKAGTRGMIQTMNALSGKEES